MDVDDDNGSDEYPGSPDGDGDTFLAEEEEDKETREEELEKCTAKLATIDFVMEPAVYPTMQKYLKLGGSVEQMVDMLCDNYHAIAQMINVLAEWLMLAGVKLEEVKETVENHLKDLIIKHFDPQRADEIFFRDAVIPEWLQKMIDFPTWRNLFYRLAEEYPDCSLLNLTIKLISDAGYQGEITSVVTACHQMEVYSRWLRTAIAGFLDGGEEALGKNLPEFIKMACHGEHTYLYSQVVMHSLAVDSKGGSSVRRICQELQQCAIDKGLDVTPIMLALSGAGAYPRACQALSSMLSRKQLNPADMTTLFKMYSEQDSPPVDLIRVPAFLDLLIETLFKPGSHVNPEHKHKYIHLLAYAVSVHETFKKGSRKAINKDEVKPSTQALEKTHSLCQLHRGASDLIADVTKLFHCLKFPVCAMGVLRWVDHTVSEPSYFKLNTDHTPLHLVLVDEIVTNHPLLHGKALDLLIRLFEASYEELDVLVRLELKKMLLDRMVHLLSRGSAIPVVTYVRKCSEEQDVDVSLIRHFVTEVLDVIAPPYSPEFVQLFQPLIENKDITGSVRSDDVTDFLSHCGSQSQW